MLTTVRNLMTKFTAILTTTAMQASATSWIEIALEIMVKTYSMLTIVL